MRRVIASLLPTILLAACALEIEDARLTVRKDLSSSANVLISRPVAEGEVGDKLDEEARKWARRVQSCGGSYRQVFALPEKVMVESRFDMESDRERDLLLLCIADRSRHQPSVQISRDEGLFADRYTLDLSFKVPWTIDIGGKIDLLPNKLSVEMPGRIVRHADSSYLPFDRASFRRGGRGQLVMTLQPLSQAEAEARIEALKRSLGPNPSEADAEAAADKLDSLLRMTIVSEQARFSTLEFLSILAALAAVIPFIPFIGRQARSLFRRLRKSGQESNPG